MEPHYPAADWWTDFAQNERLCKTIAEHFGWEYITIPLETGTNTEKHPHKKSSYGLQKHPPKKSPLEPVPCFSREDLGVRNSGVRNLGSALQAAPSNPTQKVYFINTGREWVSLPHMSYGGAVTGGEDMKRLFSGLKGKPARWQVRTDRAMSEHYRNEKVTSWLPLMQDEESQLQRLPSGVRRKVKKAQKNGVVVKEGGTKLLNDFYRVYTCNLHRLGAPALSEKFVRALLSKYPDDNQHHSRLFVAYDGNRAVGAALLLGAGSSFENLLFGSLQKYNRYYTTYLLHWEMIKYAISKGAKVYSFGRSSRGSGVHRYKQQWGTHDLPLFWSYSHPVRKSIKDLKFLATFWRMLPYPLAKAIGPWFAGKVY